MDDYSSSVEYTHDGKPFVKSYRLLWVWLIIFPILWVGLIVTLPYIFPDIFEAYSPYVSRANLLMTDIFVVALMAIIYHNESIYWINGMSFKAAAAMTSSARRGYARAHLRRFLLATLVYLLAAAIGIYFSLPVWFDIAVFFIALLWAAISTIKIKP